MKKLIKRNKTYYIYGKQGQFINIMKKKQITTILEKNSKV